MIVITIKIRACSAEWIPRITSGPDVIVSKDAFVAEGIEEILPANNNVGAAFYRGALYMGWRSAPSHFASDRWVVQSKTRRLSSD